MLEKLFKLSEKGTTAKIEILAGLTTFITVAYIILVNPSILADAGIPKEAAIAATIFSAAFATALMGFWANLPLAVAPGMGLNAFFTYTVVLTMGLSWQTALGAVFISGIFFIIITVTGLRRMIVEGVPDVLKSAIGVGIGLFIAFIGFKNSGIVVASEATYVTLGKVTSPQILVTLIGITLAGVLLAKNIKGALLMSIMVTTILGWIFVPGLTVPKGIGDIFSFSFPNIAPTLGALDITGAVKYGIFSVIFSFTIVELFDNIGTLIGVTRKAGLEKDGKIEGLDKALTSDAIGTIASSILGTSTVTTYVESGAGVAEGGKTGLTAVTVAVLFILSIFLIPLIGIIPTFATAPALVVVGVLMLSEVIHIKFDDFTEAMPAFLTIILMPLTFSIAQGLAFGSTSYVAIKLLTGRAKEVSLIMYVVAIAFVINFYMGGGR